jgi:shikimate dehydrogenase
MIITGATRLAAVIGWPVEHSRSPALHNAAYAATGIDAVYVALPVAPGPGKLGEIVRALAAVRALGVNITVPHKADALAICDPVDPLATRASAVNTIVFDEAGKLHGHNTDVGGFADALDERGVAPGRAIVLGAGGAARAVSVALEDRGHDVSKIARREWSALPDGIRDATLIVDATSAEIAPGGTFAEPVPIDRARPDALVCTLVYHRETPLLSAARARGLATMDGASMLIHQAARAFTLMTGVRAPLEVMRAAFTPKVV